MTSRPSAPGVRSIENARVREGGAPVVEAAWEPGAGLLRVALAEGESAAVEVCSVNPLKLLVPKPRGPSVWAFASNFGGGLIAGDRIQLEVVLQPGARCFFGTQASTKVYRSVDGRGCAQRMHAVLGPESVLVLAPDPVQLFAGSVYNQEQRFELDGSSSLVLLDWCTAGRVARGERWACARFQTRSSICVDSDLVWTDALLLDPGDGPLDGPFRLGRFNCVGLLLLIGPALNSAVEELLGEMERRPVGRGLDLIASASRISGGALLRVAGQDVEAVARFFHRRLKTIGTLLGEDPWARKW